MTITDNGYEIRIERGFLLINGTIAEDFLDCLDKTYTVSTPSAVNLELQRLLAMAFERGGEAQREDVRGRVPVLGSVA